MKRSIVLLYVHCHPGCQVKDIIRDIDVKPTTIGTSLYTGVTNGEVTFTGTRIREYYCKHIDVTNAEKRNYVFSVIRRYENLTKNQLRRITGLKEREVAQELVRLKNLGEIRITNGVGISLVKPIAETVVKSSNQTVYQKP